MSAAGGRTQLEALCSSENNPCPLRFGGMRYPFDRARPLIPLLFGLSAAIPAGRANAQSFCPGTNNNLRVMTVNADCWIQTETFPGQLSFKYDMNFETRAARIASIIQREDPDVVSIQEAFDMDCRTAIETVLTPNYPSNVTYFKADGAAYTSGTMIFSKIPFEAFTAPMKGGGSDVQGKRSGVPFDENSNFLAWNNYSNFTASEQGSSLAALMVRLRHGTTCAVNVAFTQIAGASELSTPVIKTLITTTLGSAINREPTFVLGDLKIDGDGDALPYTYTVGATTHTASFTPWHKYFNPTTVSPPGDPVQTSFFRCGTNGFSPATTCNFTANPATPYLTDAWGFEWPREDHGHTSGAVGQTTLADVADLGPQTGEREDYILHSQPLNGTTPYLCPQRLKRIFHLDPNPAVQNYEPPFYVSVESGNSIAFSDQKPASDHFALVGDFLFSRLARCSPMVGPAFGPTVIGPADWDVNISMALGATGNRRHYNWVKIDTVGTYSIGATNLSRTNIEVYHHSDLSTPIPSFHGISNSWASGRFTGPVYDLVDPPYYVRYEPSATATLPATFTAGIHRHRCSSPINDYCLLTSNVDKNVIWPSGQFMMPWDNAATAVPDAMYFVAAVDQAASGANPRVDFRVELGNNAQFPTNRMRLFNQCGYQLSFNDCGFGTCNTPLGLSWGAWGSDDMDAQLDVTGTTNNHTNGALAPAMTGTPRLVLLRIGRNCTGPNCATTSMSVRYKSNFRTFIPVSLYCADEQDPGDADDEIYIAMTTDAPAPGSSVCGPLAGFTDLKGFDEHGESNKQSTSFPGNWGFGPRTFVDRVTVTVCEEEGAPAPNTWLGNVEFSSSTIPAIGQAEVLLSGDFDADPDADYHFQYRVRTENPNTQAASCP